MQGDWVSFKGWGKMEDIQVPFLNNAEEGFWEKSKSGKEGNKRR